MGESDGVTPPDLAKNYFESINSPHKEFFTVEKSGHYVMVNNSKALENILVNEVYSYMTDKKLLLQRYGEPYRCNSSFLSVISSLVLDRV